MNSCSHIRLISFFCLAACAGPASEEALVVVSESDAETPTSRADAEVEAGLETVQCEHNGAYYDPGESFQDDCNSCTCGDNGLAACTRIKCLETVQCEHNGAYYDPGESFQDDCNSCTCGNNGLAACTRIKCS